jgi:hypothetical protein
MTKDNENYVCQIHVIVFLFSFRPHFENSGNITFAFVIKIFVIKFRVYVFIIRSQSWAISCDPEQN